MIIEKHVMHLNMTQLSEGQITPQCIVVDRLKLDDWNICIHKALQLSSKLIVTFITNALREKG